MLLVPFFRGLARHLHLACLALTATTTAVLAQNSTPTAADGFDPNVDGVVMAMVRQGDGKIIVGGQFANVQPNGGAKISRNNIARFNADGSLDTTFDPNANGAVRAIFLQQNGQVLIGGDFTTVDGNPHNYISRLNPNGSPDDSFTASIGKSIDPNVLATKPQVLAITVQENDGSVVVGGTFGSASSSGVAPVQRNNLVRFTATGALDLNYNPNPDGLVLALNNYQNGTVLVGGGFTHFQSPGLDSPISRFHIARIQPDGTVDPVFDPSADNGVTTIAVERDGKILFGGYFTSVRPDSADNSVSAYHIARVNADGTLDTDFSPTIGGDVYTIRCASDGTIYVGGHFQQVFGKGNALPNHSYLVKLLSDGSVDASFNTSLNFDVNAIAFQDDQKVVVGGAFTRAFSPGSNAEVVRNHMARLLPNGALDTAFALSSDGRVLTSVTLPDKYNNAIIVGGSFTTIGGVSRAFIAKLNQDGTVDPSFYPILNGGVYTMAYDSAHDQLVIGGSFTSVGTPPNATIRNHIARFNMADGSLDTTFDPNINANVGTIAIESSGTILVGGAFTSLQPAGTDTAVTRNYIARLTASGQVDNGFNPSSSSPINAIALQSDGKILVGGAFSYFQPGATGNVVAINNLARLNTDGTVDTSYLPNPAGPLSGQINAIVIQSDGKAVVAGQFQGFIPPGATAITARNFIARINKDGSIDSTFDPNTNDFVLTLALAGDKIVIGGQFTAFAPNGATTATAERYIARLNADGTIDDSFNLNLNEQVGNRVDYLSVQPNGDLLVGGSFTSLQAGTTTPVTRNHLARIKPNGTLDTTFDPHPSGTVNNAINAISVEPDGKLLVGGKFADLGGAQGPNLARFASEGTPDYAFNTALSTDGTVNAIAVRAAATELPTQMPGFAWLESNGTLRKTFVPTVTTQARINAALILQSGDVLLAGVFPGGGSIVKMTAAGVADPNYSVTVAGVTGMIEQPDHKVIIYGNFTTINGNGVAYIARLNEDGSVDNTFSPPAPNSTVFSAALQSNGSVVIGGQFTTLQASTDSTGTTRNYVARLGSDGKLDANFDPNLDGPVYAVTLQSDQKILLGGAFTSSTPGTSTTATTRNHILRLNTDGTVDAGFDPNAGDIVYAITLQPDQKILVGGNFRIIGGAAHDGLARLNSDGTVDASFSAGTNDAVQYLALTSDQSIVAGGVFTSVTSSGSSTQITRFHLARFSAAGDVDPTFNPALGGNITALFVAADNSVLAGGTFSAEFAKSVIVLGGSFTNVGGQPQPYLAELNEDGSINSEFALHPDAAVNALKSLPDGSYLVGGAFTKIGDTNRNGLARFDQDGTLDAFNPAIAGAVMAIGVQSDGGLVVGTDSSSALIRIDPTTGATDTTFHDTTRASAAPSRPVAVQVQADGKIVVAYSAGGQGFPAEIARLNSDGTQDASFTPAALGSSAESIRTLTLQIDGSIIVAGSFTTIGGQSVANLARLNPNGSVDLSFNPAPNGSVTAISLQQDGRLMLGGSFSAIGDLPRFSIGRVSNTGPATQVLGVSTDGKTITLLRNGTAAEAEAVAFQSSTDGINWTYLGEGQRAGAGNWQITNVSIPTTGNVYVRADVIVPGNAGTTTGIYSTIQFVNLGVQIPSSALTVAPVVSSTVWDASHYVWTIDSSGVLRIVDAFSLVTFDSGKTVLINGGAVGGKTAASASRLADLSTRGLVTSSTPLISGFSIVGTAPRPVLIRAAGPGLVPFGVTNYLKVPALVLYDANGTVVARNTGWDQSLMGDFTRVGAFPFTPGSSDAACLITLQPGTYTVQVADGGDGSGGDTLVEVYDAGDLGDTHARLMNLSTRGTVNTGSTLIGGLVVSGNAPKTMLVRGIGPALSRYGINDPLADPAITVYDVNGAVIATNDNWSASTAVTTTAADYAAAVTSAAQSAGAFPLDANSTDAALVITLPAGSYTVQLRSANGATGTGLIEVYELP